jgi:hypothetical protein
MAEPEEFLLPLRVLARRPTTYIVQGTERFSMRIRPVRDT